MTMVLIVDGVSVEVHGRPAGSECNGHGRERRGRMLVANYGLGLEDKIRQVPEVSIALLHSPEHVADVR